MHFVDVLFMEVKITLKCLENKYFFLENLENHTQFSVRSLQRTAIETELKVGVFCDLRRSPRGAKLLQPPKHSASKLSTPVAAEIEEEEEDDDLEESVYQPNLQLDDVDMLLDPSTAPAAYRKAISGLFF